jgi:hypothetical protein
MGILDARARSAERTEIGWQPAASFASSCHLRRCDASAGPPKPASQTNGKVEGFQRTLFGEWAYARRYRTNTERWKAFKRRGAVV